MNNVTPVQMANYVATLASGGKRYKVSVVDKITTPTGEVIKEYKPELVDELDIPEAILTSCERMVCIELILVQVMVLHIIVLQTSL